MDKDSEEIDKDVVIVSLDLLEKLGLVIRIGSSLLVPYKRSISYISECLESFKDYLKQKNKLNEFLELLNEDKEMALYVALGSCVLADLSIKKAEELGMRLERATVFEEKFAKHITFVYFRLIRSTPVYKEAISLLDKTFGESK